METFSPAVESIGVEIIQWLQLGVEIVGAGLVTLGVAIATCQLIKTLLVRHTEDFNGIRLTLARYLSLALEFQLGADILGTAISPGWEQIGKLGAVAVIRTGLNMVLSIELKQAGKSKSLKA